jgi:plastocyanin
MLGQVVLVDDRAGHGSDHLQVVAEGQYVNGGSVNAIAVTTPAVPLTKVARGDTITWLNADTHPHTVSSCRAPCTAVAPVRTHVFDGDLLQPFTTFTLDTSHLAPGTYDYFCEYHPFMRGAFTVQPSSGAPGARGQESRVPTGDLRAS